MNDVVTMGIDLAKNVFAVHGVDATHMYYAEARFRIIDKRELCADVQKESAL